MSVRGAVSAAPWRRAIRPAASGPGWTVAVLAMAGAWLGHLFEYVRVSGWQAGLAGSTTSVHFYFLPAGIGLLAAVAGVSAAAARLWAVLGRRLAVAERARWSGPRRFESRPDAVSARRRPPLGQLWLRLTLLQIGIWIVQENLESIGSGHRAPLLGVLAGAHALAPLVQAEVALFLASAYCLVRRPLDHRADAVRTIEAFLTRRWRRVLDTTWAVIPATATAATPLQRWGAQRWQRPPPGGPRSTFTFA